MIITSFVEKAAYDQRIQHFLQPQQGNLILLFDQWFAQHVSLLQEKKLGLLFSGGIDSSIIAYFLQKYNLQFLAVGVGIKEKGKISAEDLEKGDKAARALGIPYHQIKLSEGEALTAINETIRILGRTLTTVVNVGVGTVERIGIQWLKGQGVEFIFSGLGSEELFAGYERHVQSKNIQQACYEGLQSMYTRDLLRLMRFAETYNVSIALPFLSETLIKAAGAIPAEEKIHNDYKKWCLRKSFENHLPKEIVWRKKKAAQYGSRIDHLIGKEAKKKGYYSKEQYLLSIAESQEIQKE